MGNMNNKKIAQEEFMVFGVNVIHGNVYSIDIINDFIMNEIIDKKDDKKCLDCYHEVNILYKNAVIEKNAPKIEYLSYVKSKILYANKIISCKNRMLKLEDIAQKIKETINVLDEAILIM